MDRPKIRNPYIVTYYIYSSDESLSNIRSLLSLLYIWTFVYVSNVFYNYEDFFLIYHYCIPHGPNVTQEISPDDRSGETPRFTTLCPSSYF